MRDPNSLRPAWVEVDLKKLRRNFQLIQSECPSHLQVLSVIKDNAYGHGAAEVARIAIETGTRFLAVATLQEGIDLREAGIKAPILLFGERIPAELEYCIRHDLTCVIAEATTARLIHVLGRELGKTIPVHLKIDTGMSRFGMRWSDAENFAIGIRDLDHLQVEGAMTHFAMSDETDKSFALLQLKRFEEAIEALDQNGIRPPIKHACNSGGFLDLPGAHFNMVRIGILALGVYPSKVCRRIPGIEPVMSVKARISFLRDLQPGDKVGYGMRYEAETKTRIAIIPLGYGDGFPRVRNEGYVLVHGKRAPIVGGVSMDALTVDVTAIPAAKQWDEVVIMGTQQDETITANDLAALRKTVSYDVLTSWRERLPRSYVE